MFTGVSTSPSEEFPTNHADLTENMIADSRCKRIVAGSQWHNDMRKELAKVGPKPIKKDIDEKFRFGDGKVVRASKSWIYPTGMYGQHGQINVAEVPRQCPPLLSHKAMEELGMVLDFDNLTTSIRSAGVLDKPMLRADSGHPILKIRLRL